MTLFYIIIALIPITLAIYLSTKKVKTDNIVYPIQEIEFHPQSKESEMLILMNIERVNLGLKPLVYDMFTIQLAKRRVQELIDLGITHQYMGDEREELVLLGADNVLENIALGYTTMDSLHNAFINSPKHYNNIINPKIDWCGFAYKDKHYCILFGDEIEIE